MTDTDTHTECIMSHVKIFFRSIRKVNENKNLPPPSMITKVLMVTSVVAYVETCGDLNYSKQIYSILTALLIWR